MNICEFIKQDFLPSNNQVSLQMFMNDSTYEYSEDNIVDFFIDYIKKKFKITIVRWDPSNRFYPSYMFLSGDKGILAYVDFKYIESKKPFSDIKYCREVSPLLETLRIAESHLDRPVFYIYFLDCDDKKGIYFETNEQIKDRWFNNKIVSKYYLPVENEMGNFENLLQLWIGLKKNKVKI